MHMPKNLFLVGATALCLTAFAALAKDTDADAQLREAMRKSLSESKPQAAPASTAKPTTAPIPAATAAPTTTTASPIVTTTAAAPANTTNDPEVLREAMRTRMATESTATASTAPSATKSAATSSTRAASFTPLTPPPSPLPASKSQRLQALLEQYKADQITPEQYHSQRAKIIAE